MQKQIRIYLLMIILSVTSISFADEPVQEIQEIIDSVNNVLSISEHSNADWKAFINKWDQFLKSHTGSTNHEFQIAINENDKRYKESIIKSSKKTEEVKEFKHNYSDEWLNELGNKFSKQYIVDNKSYILLLLSYLSFKNEEGYLAESDKEMLYAEGFYLNIVNTYVDLFLEFYNSLDEQTRDKFTEIKRLFDNFKKIYSESTIKHLICGYRYSLISARIKTNFNPDLFNFLSSCPSLSKPFDPMKAVTNFKEFIKE